MKLAVYPGSFDPVTLGHLDIIVRASKIFDKLIVGVPINPDKHASFSVEERMELLRRATQAEGLANVEIDKVDGLLADYAKRRGAMVVVKGLRALSDFEYEFQQALTNKKLNPELETMFQATSAENKSLNPSKDKQVAGFRRKRQVFGFIPHGGTLPSRGSCRPSPARGLRVGRGIRSGPRTSAGRRGRLSPASCQRWSARRPGCR